MGSCEVGLGSGMLNLWRSEVTGLGGKDLPSWGGIGGALPSGSGEMLVRGFFWTTRWCCGVGLQSYWPMLLRAT
jgi:hypothetical protein